MAARSDTISGGPMTQPYRFSTWFLHTWPRTTLPIAAFLLLLCPVALAATGTLTFLIYLQSIVYIVHQYEEHAEGQFKKYANLMFGNGREVLGDVAIFWTNIGGVWCVDLAAFYAAYYFKPAAGLAAVYLSLVNGVIHIAGALRSRSYNPGLWTAIILFLPLGGVTLYEFARSGQATVADHIAGFGVAVLVHAAIMVHVLTNRKRLGIG